MLILKADSLTLWTTFVVLLSVFRCRAFSRRCLCAHISPLLLWTPQTQTPVLGQLFPSIVWTSAATTSFAMFYDRGSVYMATTEPLRAGMHCSPSVSRIVGNDFPRYQTISDKTLTRAPERDCCLLCRVPSPVVNSLSIWWPGILF